MSSKLSPQGGRGTAPNLSEVDRIEGPFETNVPERTRGLMARLFARREKQADVERRSAPSGGAPTPAGEAVGAAPPKRRRLSLALQGGGAFGAFTWGVLDRLLEADEIDFDAVSGASAGAINAVLLASGLARGGRDEARASLDRFWHALGECPVRVPLLSQEIVVAAMSQLSPYQFNPLDVSRLRDLLEEEVDFEAVRTQRPIRLLISATRVHDGALRVFRTKAVTLDVVLASACLPRLHHAVNIHGEPHWDGGYAANPPLIPVVAVSGTPNVLVVQLVPTDHADLPVTKSEIEKRLGQITFNAPLQKELAAISLASKLIRTDQGAWHSRLTEKIKALRLERISAEEHVEGLSDLSSLNTDVGFLLHLRDRGRAAADAWLTVEADRLEELAAA